MPIQLFDTSLRDGIQNANVVHFSTDHKKKIFDDLCETKWPQRFEVGSLCSPKVLPIMNDTLDIYEYAIQTWAKSDIYVLIPSLSKFYLAMDKEITSMSFLTSVSNVFHMKNTVQTTRDTKRDFKEIFDVLQNRPDYSTYRKKLYISCIGECPLSGKIDNKVIVEELRYYSENYDFDELCISDTCGTLAFVDFREMVEKAHISPEKLSVHLHMSPQQMSNIEQILHYCFRSGIHKFDVSVLESGGCSVTMPSESLLPNLSYDTFHQILRKYKEKNE
jgi:isopropylmalate/homocitrate/citramalate synthase